jgi:hypothetical protein
MGLSAALGTGDIEIGTEWTGVSSLGGELSSTARSEGRAIVSSSSTSSTSVSSSTSVWKGSRLTTARVSGSSVSNVLVETGGGKGSSIWRGPAAPGVCASASRIAASMKAGLGRESRALSLAICTSGSSIGVIGAARARGGGGVLGGGPEGSGGKCRAPARAPLLDPRAGGGGGGSGGGAGCAPIRGRTGGALGGGGGADSVVVVGGRTGGGGGTMAGGGVMFTGSGGGAALGVLTAGGGPALVLGTTRPESEASSSVAARLSSSARTDSPASVAASTARLSHTIASYFSP